MGTRVRQAPTSSEAFMPTDWPKESPVSVFEAFREATDIVNGDKKAAADLYVKVEKPKLSVDEVYRMLIAPGMDFTITPSGVMQYADFMFAHGLIKVKPASWKDVFFPEVHDRSGN